MINSSRDRPRPRSFRAEMWAKAALTATLVLAPQLLGGVLPWAAALIGAMAVGTLFAVWMAMRERRQEARAPWVLGFMVAAFLWTGVQAVPLPCVLVEAVAPDAVEQVRLTGSALAGKGKKSPGIACTISRDRGATEVELVEGVAILCIFCACWMLCAAGHKEHVLRSVVASVLLVALVSLCHRLAGADKVFGLYEPRYAPRPIVGPLMNPNQLGGFIAMGFPAALALGMRAERAKRLVWLALAVFIAGSAFLPMSRGGIGALLAGGTLFFLLTVRIRLKRGRSYGALSFAGLAIAAGIGLGAYTVLEKLEAEIEKADLSRLELIEKTWAYAMSQPWVGVGRGGFSAAFTQYFGTNVRFTHAENLPSEWIAEWGLPLGGALLLALGFALAQGLYNSRSTLRIGALCGVVAISLQGLVDFGLELCGVVTVASALLAVALYSGYAARRKLEQKPDRLPGLQRLSPIIVTAGVLLLVVLVPRILVFDSLAIQDRLQAAFEAGERKLFRQELLRGLQMHPSEPNFALVAGAEALRHDDPAALKWLNRTMQLAPQWEKPHVLAASWLLRKGRVLQALLEAREAETRRPKRARKQLCRALRIRPRIELLLRAAPPGEQRAEFLEGAASCFDPRTPFVERIDAELLKLDPYLPGPRIRRASRLQQQGQSDAAIRELESLVARAPSDLSAHLALGNALLRAGRAEEALQAMKKAEQSVSEPWQVIALRARAQAALKDAASMRESVAELRGLSRGDTRRLKSAMHLLAGLESSLGNRARAIDALEEAYKFSPDNRTLARIAGLAEQMGARRRAAAVYARLCELEPNNRAWCGARDRLLGRTGAGGGAFFPSPAGRSGHKKRRK